MAGVLTLALVLGVWWAWPILAELRALAVAHLRARRRYLENPSTWTYMPLPSDVNGAAKVEDEAS